MRRYLTRLVVGAGLLGSIPAVMAEDAPLSHALADGLAICAAATAGPETLREAADAAGWETGTGFDGGTLYAAIEGRKRYTAPDAGPRGSFFHAEFQTYPRRRVTFCAVEIPLAGAPASGIEAGTAMAEIGASVGGSGRIETTADGVVGVWEGIEEGGGFHALARLAGNDLLFQITYQRPR